MLNKQLAKRFLLILAAVFLMSCVGCGDSMGRYYLNKAMPYYMKKDYNNAFKYVKKSADSGFWLGQCMVAEMYKEGHGVKADLKEMIKYYEKAINNKNIPEKSKLDAKGKLGYSYLKRKEIRDVAKGEAYLTDAANRNGDIGSKTVLADCYYEGIGVKKDYKKAFDWAYKAYVDKTVDSYHSKEVTAIRGRERDTFRAGAEYLRGMMYLYGQGTAKNPRKAYAYFEMAAEGGNSDAESMMAYQYVIGAGVIKDRNKGMRILRSMAKKNAKAKELLAEIKKKNL
ncbi:sel1 repeat family protein [bacterium]|nr:sel1 repeat family protein [bacterium]